MQISSHRENLKASAPVRVKRFGTTERLCHYSAMKLRLKELRRERGWTQEHVAGLIGSTKSHVSEMESGKKGASGPMLEKIAKAFDTDIHGIIDAGPLRADMARLASIMDDLPESDRESIIRSAEARRALNSLSAK